MNDLCDKAVNIVEYEPEEEIPEVKNVILQELMVGYFTCLSINSCHS